MEATIGIRVGAACASSEEEAEVVRQTCGIVSLVRGLAASHSSAVLGTSRG